MNRRNKAVNYLAASCYLAASGNFTPADTSVGRAVPVLDRFSAGYQLVFAMIFRRNFLQLRIEYRIMIKKCVGIYCNISIFI